jgi:hypothetical protein
MSDQPGKVLNLGPFELSIGHRLLTTAQRPYRSARGAMDPLIITGRRKSDTWA